MIGPARASDESRRGAAAGGTPSAAAAACFRLLARAVSLSGVDNALIAELGGLLGVSAERGPGDRHVACAREDGRYVVRTGGSTQLCASRADLLAVLATTLPSLLLDQPGWYELHAGALALGDQAHLFLGPSYSGKSSLAFAAWRAGQQPIGDDYLLVEPTTGAVVGVPKPLKIRLSRPTLPDRLAAALPAAGHVLGRIEAEPCLVLGRSLPGMAPAGRRYRIGSLHILSRAGARRTRKRPATRHQAIAALLAQTFVGSRSSLGVLRCFAAVLRERRAFVLEVGEHDQASALALLLDGSGSRR